MQSSLISGTSRVPRPQSFSNNSVHISRQVSVTSTRAASPPRRNSTMSPKQAIQARKVGSLDAGSSTGVPYRWNSKASAQYARSSTQSVRRPQTPDPEALDNNRESMKALSEFLMSKEPPPNHFMSMLSSDDEKSIGPLKRSTFKILGRKKKRKGKPERLLQLPDSAVAARTSKGARYIAISIPIEHDQLHKPVDRHIPPPRHSSQRAGERPERAAVTVLKPVAELRESTSTYVSGVGSRDALHEPELQVPGFVATPPNDVIGNENAITLQKYYAQLKQHQQQTKLSAADMTYGSKRDPSRIQRSYIAISPIENNQQESDPRHSGGTAYSTTSIATGQPKHSRVPSNASSGVTVISSVKLELPTRNSSIPKVSKSHLIEQTLHPLNQHPTSSSPRYMDSSNQSPNTAAQQSHGHVRGSSALSGQTGIESITTVTSIGETSTGSTPSPPVLFTADIARKYSNAANGGGPHIVRSTTPRVNSGSGTPVPRPKTAPPASSTRSEQSVPLSQFNEASKMARRSVSQRNSDSHELEQSRHERVKAKKRRDIEQTRARSSEHINREAKSIIFDSTSHSLRTKNVPPAKEAIPPPVRSPKRRRNSEELNRLRKANTLSPIMLVAVLPPYADIPLISKQSPTPTPSVITARYRPTSRNSHTHSRLASKRASQVEYKTQTPPRSPESSFGGSDSDSDLDSHSRISRIGVSSQSLRSTLLETRRKERRVKRNISLREKDLDTRLSRIERDNMVLIRTLNGIASSFDEMRRVGGIGHRVSRSRAGADLGVVSADEERRRNELRVIEPLMRDLNVFAPRVSAESQRERRADGFGGVYDEYDEDDGGSIL